MGKFYTDDEKKFIIDNYEKLGALGCSQILGRPRHSVQATAQKLGVRCYSHIEWTKDDISFLKDNFPVYGGKWCAERLSRSFHATHKMAEKLGLEIQWKRFYIDKQGYKILCFSRTNKVYEHRHIMEKSLGRPLLSTEIVHHIDGNKLNNALSNLVIITRADHINEHRETLVGAQRLASQG